MTVGVVMFCCAAKGEAANAKSPWILRLRHSSMLCEAGSHETVRWILTDGNASIKVKHLKSV
jgi:hypothetical protein